jgi:hypothetical protein
MNKGDFCYNIYFEITSQKARHHHSFLLVATMAIRMCVTTNARISQRACKPLGYHVVDFT